MFGNIIIIICMCITVVFTQDKTLNKYTPANYKLHSLLVIPHFDIGYVRDLTEGHTIGISQSIGKLYGMTKYTFKTLQDDFSLSYFGEGFFYVGLPNEIETGDGGYEYRKEKRNWISGIIGGKGKYYFWDNFKIGSNVEIKGNLKSIKDKFDNRFIISNSNKNSDVIQYTGDRKRREYSTTIKLRGNLGIGRVNSIEEIIIAHEIIERINKRKQSSINPTMLARKIGELKNRPVYLDSTGNRVTIFDELIRYLDTKNVISYDSLFSQLTLEMSDLLNYTHFKRNSGYEIKFIVDLHKEYGRYFIENISRSGVSVNQSDSITLDEIKEINSFNNHVRHHHEKSRIKENIDTLLYGIACNWYIPLNYKRQLDFTFFGKIGNGYEVKRSFENDIMVEKKENLLRQGILHGGISYTYYPTILRKYYSTFNINYKRQWEFKELLNNLLVNKIYPKRIRKWEMSWLSGAEFLVTPKVKYKIYGRVRYNNPNPIVTEYDGKKPFEVSLGTSLYWYIF